MHDSQAALTEREAVALEFTDRVMAYRGRVSTELLSRVKQHFSTTEIIALEFQIGLMNAANWFAITMELERE